MIVLLAFAFLAGLFTVLSPCILPILPVVLSVGTLGGRWRPLGIIVGLILSFSFFTLALTALVQSIGLSVNVLRISAITLIFLFGMVMLFPALSNWFAKITGFIASAGQKLQPKEVSGRFWGGFVFGLALGLLWTPCAGPILATIVTLVASHALSLTAVLMTVAYGVGVAIPLFLIAYGSGKVIQSSRFLSRHAEGIRRFFGAVMIIFAVMLVFNWDLILEQKLMRFFPEALVESNPRLEEELKKLRGQTTVQGKAPELVGIVDWINSPPLTLKELRGRVVLIDFWTYSCINCIRTLPYLEQWDKDYRDKGLTIIGVHTPEFEFEKNLDNIKKAAKQLGVEYPIAVDSNYATWRAYNNRYWPAHYLIDQEGNIRMVHFGEGAYQETENAIRSLLGMAPIAMPQEKGKHRPITPETYLGLARASSYQMPISPGRAEYAYSAPLGENKVGLKGAWQVGNEFLVAESDRSFLDLNCLAKQVYLVLGGRSETPVEVVLDGQLVKRFKVDQDRKYDLIDASYGPHELSIKVPRGIKAYVFTFGDE